MRAEIKYGTGLTVRELADIAGCERHNIGEDLLDKRITAFATDSREVGDDTVFVAIVGERVDGHSFIRKAHESGAILTLGERVPDGCTLPMIVSRDGVEAALMRIASTFRAKFGVLGTAVTGSVGKTTTKEMMWSVLSRKFNTHKTEGNFNSTVGLPLSLLTLDETHEAAVWEMGMSARGEIEAMSKAARPKVAAITNIGISHIEMLGSRENIRDAKLEIRSGMPDDGVLILNGDEPLLCGITGARYVSVERTDTDYFAENITADASSAEFDLHSAVSGRVTHIVLPIAGRHNVLDAMLAFAVGEAVGMEPCDIAQGLAAFKTTGRRQHVYERAGMTIIEDCYNAAPDSMKAALDVLKECRGRRIAVLGDMRELGAFTGEMHREVGRYLKGRCDMLFTFGRDSLLYAEEAAMCGIGHIESFTDLDDVTPLVNALGEVICEGDVILFKASNSLQLERVIIGLELEDEAV